MLPVNGDLDFKNNAGILNLGAATTNGQPIIWEQLQEVYNILNGFIETVVIINPLGITSGVGYSETVPKYAGVLNYIHIILTPYSSDTISFSLKKNSIVVQTINVTSTNRESLTSVTIPYLATDYIGVDINSTYGDVKSAVIKLIFTKT